MPTRVLLAILILTNPICCQMFGSTGTVRTEDPAPKCDGCACKCSEPEQPKPSSDQDAPHAPCECPNCELCQCICAGAVVEDAVIVDDTDGTALIGAVLECDTEVVSHLPPQSCSRAAQIASSHDNVGRAARLLHCSLLC